MDRRAGPGRTVSRVNNYPSTFSRPKLNCLYGDVPREPQPLEAERTATCPTVDVAYHAGLGSTVMAKRTKRKAASPLKRETERLTPAPPGRKHLKLGPDRSPQRDPRKTPAKE